ncbi:rhamnosyl transferase [Fulvimarina pelagi HTCC2506]|uniref:Rhamnosyl transferase n=2 Tax=Fulvimarina pelagi TaxID=217511 RepID=Q0G193_9HYPH|nr:glycosyltransferase family A protein [Fulvimarina pelagi]EAU41188.1 rhamnosyl transferase [Fulvimarina pelagi HTCC2506]BAT30801.1 rhamnosyl transferase [Fulvimarina pelagi]
MKPVRNQQDGPLASKDRPVFSVIVPVFEQWHLAKKLLDCLDRQTIEASAFEILLVNDEPPDTSPPDLRHEKARLLQGSNRGSYTARNLGAARANGRYFVFTDADCLPDPDWLKAIASAFEASAQEPTILIGNVEMIARTDRANAYEMYDIVKGIPQARYVRRGYGATANLAVSRAVFERVGGFDTNRLSGGDAEFCRRATARTGASVTFLPDATVHHPARHDWRSIATKARRVKGGQVRSGTAKQKIVWTARTFAPPVRGLWMFLRAGRHPLRYRLWACLVQLRVWLLEMAETVRLLLSGTPERR